MINLIIKDLLVLKKVFLLALLYIPFFMIVFKDSGNAMISVGIVGFTYILITSSCASDDKAKIDILMNSLPLKRFMIVFSKYLSVLLYAVISLIIYFVCSWAAGVLKLPFVITGINIVSVFVAMFIVVLMNSIFLPLFFRYGYIKSRIFNSILFFASFFGINLIGSSIQKGNNGNLIFKEFIVNFANQSDFMILIELLVVGLIILFSSLMISVKAYSNREF